MKKDITITLDEFPAYLKGRYPGDIAAIAKQLGVGEKLVYMLLSGRRKPSSAILRKMGLEVVYRDRGKR